LLDDAHSHVVRVWGIGRPEQPLSVVEGRRDVEGLIQAATIVGLRVSG
jgi:hypothetical protein